MGRALLFGATGVAWFAFWVVTKPGTTSIESMQQWPNVIWFSSTLILLAVALVAFGRMLGGRSVGRMAGFSAATVVWMSAANVVEDGFRVDAAFFAFIAGMLVFYVALAGLAVAIVRSLPGRARFLATIPVANAAGLLLFPPVGGPIMLAAWVVAAVAVLRPVVPVPTAGEPAPSAAGAP